MTERKKIPDAVRDRLLVEAMHRCCLCPEHHDITEIHHIVPLHKGGPDTEDNLMVLCGTCHDKIHRIRNRYTERQLRMYKERWVRLCSFGLPLDVRIAWAFNHTQQPLPSRTPPGAALSSGSPVVQGQASRADYAGAVLITHQVEEWLLEAGYEYHCFISWAHQMKSRDMVECGKRIKDAIEQDLALSIAEPRVFFDETDVGGGAKWREAAARALCRSVAMVAICAPVYYHPALEWGGLEWAAMEMLSESRLPGEDFKAIIPIILRQRGAVPGSVAEVRWVDLSRVISCGKRYYRHPDFRQKMIEVGRRIEEIAFVMACNGVVANCEQFQLPTRSAFSSYEGTRQRSPFRS